MRRLTLLPHESLLFYGIDAVGVALYQLAPQYTALEVCNYANRIDADLFFAFDFIPTPEIHRDPAKDVLFFANTGGSTGEPKCVMYSDNSLHLTVHQTLHSPLPFAAKEKWLRVCPIFSGSAAIANHHLPLCNGTQ